METLEDQIKMEIPDDCKFECPGDQTDDNSPLSIEKKSPPGLMSDNSPEMVDFVSFLIGFEREDWKIDKKRSQKLKM